MSDEENEIVPQSNEYYAIMVDKEEDAKMLLNLYINYVKAQAKSEKPKGRDYKYRDKDGNPKIPFNLFLRKLYKNDHSSWQEEVITVDYNSKRNKEKKGPYVPMKDRIPGQVYNGKVFQLKNERANLLLRQAGIVTN